MLQGSTCANIPSLLSGKSLVHDTKAFRPDILCSAREESKHLSKNIGKWKIQSQSRETDDTSPQTDFYADFILFLQPI